MTSKYRFGCGRKLIVFIMRGYSHRKIQVECGSTAYDGGVNQCRDCSIQYPVDLPREEESDMDWYERQSDDN